MVTENLVYVNFQSFVSLLAWMNCIIYIPLILRLFNPFNNLTNSLDVAFSHTHLFLDPLLGVDIPFFPTFWVNYWFYEVISDVIFNCWWYLWKVLYCVSCHFFMICLCSFFFYLMLCWVLPYLGILIDFTHLHCIYSIYCWVFVSGWCVHPQRKHWIHPQILMWIHPWNFIITCFLLSTASLKILIFIICPTRLLWLRAVQVPLDLGFKGHLIYQLLLLLPCKLMIFL